MGSVSRMNFLIIEDNRSKLKQIKSFIKKNYHETSVHDALSYTAGLRRLYEEKWDVILLDMSLPIYDISQQETGGDKKPVAGKEIMKRMIHRKIIIPTIVITQFDTFGDNEISINRLNQEFCENMSEIWCGTINYEDSTNLWQIELKKLLDEVLRRNLDDKDFDC